MGDGGDRSPGRRRLAAEFFSFGFFGGNMGYLVSAVFFFCWIYLWGSIAQRLGKKFLAVGRAELFFGGLPLLILAFDGSLPRRRWVLFSHR